VSYVLRLLYNKHQIVLSNALVSVSRSVFNSRYNFATEAGALARITFNTVYGKFRPDLEAFPHSQPHLFIGEHMQTMFSPDDPLFMLHHGQIDRIWTIFQDYRNFDNVTSVANVTSFYFSGVGASLTSALPFAGAGLYAAFFNSPNTGQTPTPQELHFCNGNLSIVHVTYVNDNLALLLKQMTTGTPNPYAVTNNPSWVQIAASPVATKNCSAAASPSSSNVTLQSVCRRNRSPCVANSTCCSLNCNAGVCRIARHRFMKQSKFATPQFSNQHARTRWSELMELGKHPLVALNSILKEECTAIDGLTSPVEWIQMQNGVYHTRMYKCYPYGV
jgi:hypothetical protein